MTDAVRAVWLVVLVVLAALVTPAVSSAAEGPPIDVVGGEADPATVPPDRTVDHQIVNVTVENVSADGNSDTFLVRFPDALAGNITANGASVVSGSASMSSSPEVVDGYDNDGLRDTIVLQTDDDAGGHTDLTLSIDAKIDYPDAPDGTVYEIDARADDSDGDSDTAAGVTSVTVEETAGGINLIEGSADPDSVAPDSEIEDQFVNFTVENVSADGGADTFYVRFPDVMAGNLSPDDVGVSDPAAISESIETADGYDGDGLRETLHFKTDDDSGGDSTLSITVDTTVDYPDAPDGTVYEIDVRAVDSDGDSDTATGITSVTISEDGSTSSGSDTTAPAISDFTLTNPSDRTLRVSFESNETLADVRVSVSGAESTVLDESDFSATAGGGTYTYTATYEAGTTGDFTATLEVATDDAGNDGADGQSDSVTISSDTTPTDSSSDTTTTTDSSAGGGGGDSVTTTADSSVDGSGSGTTTTATDESGTATATTSTDGDAATATDVPTATADQNYVTPFAPTADGSSDDDSGGFPGLATGALGSLVLLLGGMAVWKRDQVLSWLEQTGLR